MAKKAARPKKKPTPAEQPAASHQRKERYDSQRLSVVVERLREQAARLSQLARSMDEAGVAEIVVDGHAMLVRGLNQTDNFADNTSRAVREAKSGMQRL